MNLITLMFVALVVYFILWAIWNRISKGKQFFTPSNYLRSAPSGSWTEIEAPPRMAFWWFVGTMLIVAWMMVNVPEMFGLAVIYFSMLIIYMVVWVSESLSKKMMGAILSPKLTKNRVLLGVIVGILWVPIAALLSVQAGQPLLLVLSPLAVLAIWGVAIPLAEELAFTGVLLPSAAEDFGIIPALILKSSVFTAFHWFAATVTQTQPSLPVTFGFSLVASVLALRTRSVLPAVVMHSVSNTVLILLAILFATA